MKLEIYQEKQKEIKEEPVRLALRQRDYGIMVHVVDENGNCVEGGNLVLFYSNGTACHMVSVNPSLGFQLNEFGQIKERGKDD